jgi:2-oxo-4-hydroxy-4-carboxy-5-ureidoimidazoline decarboxylase
MQELEFVRRYGGIYENSPWVAQTAAPLVDGSADIDVIARVMADCVDNASRERQLALIRAHPDLAGKAAVAGELTDDSTLEQSSAGLDRCTPDEYKRFQVLNNAYRRKFGFPFVMAVRNCSRAQILAAFESRLDNDYDAEFENALLEIHRIARLRLVALGAN